MSTDTSKGRGRPTDEEILGAAPRGVGGKEAQVGAFVLIGLISFVLVLFWMTDPATLRGRYMLVTQVDHAGGVRAGDPVQMQGVNVGRVHGFEMVNGDSVDITMEIEKEWFVPRGSYTIMGEAGLFGGRALEIVRGVGPDSYVEGDTIAGEGASGSGLLASVDRLSARAEAVLGSFDAMLNEETVGSVQGAAKEFEALLTELSSVTREQRASLADLTESLASAAASFEATSTAAGPDIASAAARADSAMAMLVATSESVDAATASLTTILGRMERGEGTLGRLSADETLYVSMTTAMETMTALLADLQANPKKYINISIF